VTFGSGFNPLKKEEDSVGVVFTPSRTEEAIVALDKNEEMGAWVDDNPDDCKESVIDKKDDPDRSDDGAFGVDGGFKKVDKSEEWVEKDDEPNVDAEEDEDNEE
jgi:hypothetical protein